MPVQAPLRLTLQHLLFATDFSEISAAALPFAVAVARRFESTIHAVHVLSHAELQPTPESAPVALEYAITEGAEQQMAELLRSSAFAGVPHDGRIRSGAEIWAEIEAVIESEKIDLVVLGSHGREGLKQIVLGSIAEAVFRTAPCPVLVVGPKVKPRASTDGIFREILFATDLSPASLKVFPFVQAFADENQANLIVVHATQERIMSEHERQVTSESLRKWMRELIPPRPRLDYEVLCGPAADEILRLAAERECDLIMLGAHHASSFASHLPGAVAHRIVAEAPCPVLTVHRRESAPDWY